MDYLSILLNGCADPNSRNHFSNYLFREYKKAEREHYELNEFFNGCVDVINHLEHNLKEQVNERYRELSVMLHEAQNGTLKYRDLQGKTYEQKQQETIKYCERELSDVRPDGVGSLSFTVNLFSLTKGRFTGLLSHADILVMKREILQTKIKAHYDKSETDRAVSVKMEIITSGLINTRSIESTEIGYGEEAARKELQKFTTHEKLFEALIYSANEEHTKPIAEAYELLKEVWFFLNSDNATFNGKEVGKEKRPLLVNPVIVGKANFDDFFDAEITYCSTQNKIRLKEQFFISDISEWIARKIKNKGLSIARKGKLNEFLEYIKTKELPTQLSKKEEAELEQPTFENNFDNIPPNEIYNHFKIGLVEKGYLTDRKLNDYLKSAFELETVPETLFKLKHTPRKQSIYTVFYTYYKDIAGKKHYQQNRYAELLGKYFEGYDTHIIRTNWAREYKPKR